MAETINSPLVFPSGQQRSHIMKFKKSANSLVFTQQVSSEPNLKLRHRHKNDRIVGGLSRDFVWATIGEEFLNSHISAKNKDIKL